MSFTFSYTKGHGPKVCLSHKHTNGTWNHVSICNSNENMGTIYASDLESRGHMLIRLVSENIQVAFISDVYSLK